MNILIVDDSPTMRKMIQVSLKSLDAEFGEAGNGLEALEQLALKPYQAMTLDINMPDMHGLEVIQFVRQQPAYQDLPILVVTTRTDEASLQMVEAAENTRLLNKPFSPSELLAAVKEMIEGSA